MDVYHTGKEDKDDHRLVRERLLEVALPDPPEDGSAIKLEDCLESYFNNKIEVKRHLQRRNTVQSFRSMDAGKGQVLHVETLELRSDSPRPGSPSMSSSNTPSTATAVNMRTRADSIFSQRRIDTSEPSEKKTHDDITIGSGRARTGTIQREILMPAWQFFSLIRKWDFEISSTMATRILCVSKWIRFTHSSSIYLNSQKHRGSSLLDFMSISCEFGRLKFEPLCTDI
jgi:hypothetical protein